MRGIIERIWENESKKGQPYLTLLINGQKYSLWDKKQFDQFQEGDQVEYKWRQSGNFRNITEIERVEDEKYTDMERRMTRMGCLKYACSLLSTMEMEPGRKSGFAIAIAKHFEQYILEPELDGEE